MNKQNLFISSSEKRKSDPTIKSVIIKILILILALFIIFWTQISPQYMFEYNGAIIDKVNRLKEIDEPKIVLVGNSNVAFGIRSELIENEFGMPVVDAGLHGGLGDEFHENLTLYNINSGDIIIQFPHSYCAKETKMEDYPLAWITIENHTNLWKYIPKSEWYNMFLAFPTYVKKCVKLYIEGVGNLQDEGTSYTRGAFNEYGDNIYARYDTTRYIFPNDYETPVPEIDDKYINRINRNNRVITEKGAKYFIAGCPYACNNKINYIEEFKRTTNILDEKLDCDIISDLSDYLYPYDYFYNTQYHLTEEGAVVRTNQLISDLKKYLQ